MGTPTLGHWVKDKWFNHSATSHLLEKVHGCDEVMVYATWFTAVTQRVLFHRIRSMAELWGQSKTHQNIIIYLYTCTSNDFYTTNFFSQATDEMKRELQLPVKEVGCVQRINIYIINLYYSMS